MVPNMKKINSLHACYCVFAVKIYGAHTKGHAAAYNEGQLPYSKELKIEKNCMHLAP